MQRYRTERSDVENRLLKAVLEVSNGSDGFGAYEAVERTQWCKD